jgi:beta-N-acetylhexosaminidase
VVKHFPGLGGATANTDLAPGWTRPWATMRASDVLPFTAAVRAGLPAVMVSNARVTGLTPLPASLSHAVITNLLRHELGFAGLVLTDSLSAGAIGAAGYGVPAATVQALRAGADMMIFSADRGQVSAVTTQAVSAVSAAVQSGTVLRTRLADAVSHVLAAKRVNLCGSSDTRAP